MIIKKLTGVATMVGSLLVVSTVSGCGGGGDTDNIAKGIAALREGNRELDKQVRETQAEQAQTHERQKAQLARIAKDTERNRARAEAHLEKIGTLRGQLREAERAGREDTHALNGDLDEAIRSGDATLKAFRDHFAATEKVLETGRIERQRLTAAGALNAARLYEFLDFSTQWSRLVNLYLEDSKTTTDTALLLRMQRLAHRTSGTAAEDDPSDPQALEVLSQRRKRETAEIKALLAERHQRMLSAARAGA
jgi:cell division protein FtsB